MIFKRPPHFVIAIVNIFCISVLQLEMEDGDEIDAMLHQTGGWKVIA